MGKVANVVFTVGGIASGAKGLLDIVRGATPGQTILAGKHLIVETKKSSLFLNVIILHLVHHLV